MEDRDREPPPDRRFFRTAALMLVTVGVAYLALDDITTDDAASFGFERFGLLCCWAWLFVASARLGRDRRTLGVASWVLLGATGPALGMVGPGTEPGVSFEYIGALAFLLWFSGLSVYLAVLGWQSHARKTA